MLRMSSGIHQSHLQVRFSSDKSIEDSSKQTLLIRTELTRKQTWWVYEVPSGHLRIDSKLSSAATSECNSYIFHCKSTTQIQMFTVALRPNSEAPRLIFWVHSPKFTRLIQRQSTASYINGNTNNIHGPRLQECRLSARQHVCCTPLRLWRIPMGLAHPPSTKLPHLHRQASDLALLLACKSVSHIT